jgi:3-hydroxyisobutyrate dehydrogenase-like beta-hydroxyacid dehydrogenase
MVPAIALIGFGEAGETFAGAAAWGSRAVAYDALAGREAAARCSKTAFWCTPGKALRGAELVLSLVTADQALPAASVCAPLLEPGAVWCDMNSVAPETKREAARSVEAAGGRYVDVAILAPVKPAALAVPLLLSGPDAAVAEGLLRQAGFTNLRVVGAEVGRASAIKMIRSVMVKGMEALTAEMMEAAQKAGVADEVLASLDASDKPEPWRKKADYQLERMDKHGLRRAAEMEESAKTLAALGVEPVLTRGTIRRQREMAGKGLPQ